MNLNVADWVQVLAFGALLGAAGQIVRIVAGLKKLNDEAKDKNVPVAALFSTTQFVFSILIGAVAGLLGAIALGINPKDVIATDKLFALLGAGYAGADFIEAFMKKHVGNWETTGVARATMASSATGAASSPANMQAPSGAVEQSGPAKPNSEEAVG
jgi:hypothetical protein